MRQINRVGLVVVAMFVTVSALHAGTANGGHSHIRFNSARIQEVFRHGTKHSPSFQDLVAAIELLDAIVYVEEGSCRPGPITPCLLAMPSASGSRTLMVKFDPRQPLRRAVTQLAHELYHAAEVGREADVSDQASMRSLYARIGFHNCLGSDDCWETRAAIAFEARVMEDLGGHVPD